MPPSPNTFACEPASASPGCRAHGRRHRLACPHADKGVRRTRRADDSNKPASLRDRDARSDRAQHSRPRRPAARRGVRAHDVRRDLPGGDAPSRHSPRVARERRARLERCARDRTLRRQIYDQFLLARAGIPTPATWAAEIAGNGARDRPAREPAGPLVLKPLFGSTGAWSEADPDGGRAARSGRGCGRLLPAALSRRRGRWRLPRLPPARLARTRDRRHGAACGRLDHEP